MKTDRLQGILFEDEPMTKSNTAVSALLQRTATLAGHLKHLVTHTSSTGSNRKAGNAQADDLLKRLRHRQ